MYIGLVEGQKYSYLWCNNTCQVDLLLIMQLYSNHFIFSHDIPSIHASSISYPAPFPSRLRHILPQTPQPLLRPLQHIILLTDREPQPIFRHPHILLGIKLCRRDSCKTQLHDQEPGELVIPRAVSNLRRELIIFGQIDASEVCEDEIAAFWLGVLFRRHQYSHVSPKEKRQTEGNVQASPTRQTRHRTFRPSPSSPFYSVPKTPTLPPSRIPPPQPLAAGKRWRSRCAYVRRRRSGSGLQGR